MTIFWEIVQAKHQEVDLAAEFIFLHLLVAITLLYSNRWVEKI